MPTINKTFLLKLVVFFVVATGGLVGAHTWQAGRIPGALLTQARRAADEGRTDAAVRYYSQYLEFRPDDTDAREQLASHAAVKAKNDPAALIFLYDKILRADPDRHAIRRKALEACLHPRLRRFGDAESHAGILIQAFPTESDLYRKQAAARVNLHKHEEARESFENALKHAPKDVEAYQLLAQFLWKELQRPADARKVVDQLVAAMPHSAAAYVTRAKFDVFSNETADPMPDLKTALEVDPENADALLMMAEQLQKRKQIATAHDCLTSAVRLYPQDARMVRALAWLELNRGSIGAAVAVLEDGMIRIQDSSFDLMVPLADLLVQLGETARTEEIVQKLESRTGSTPRLQVKYLRGRLAMRRGEWAKAVELLTALRSDAVGLPGLENQANLLLASCHQKVGNLDAEQETLKMVLNKEPNHLPARIGLGQALLNAGRFSEAEREYEQAVRSPYASGPAHVTLIRLKAARLRASGGGTANEWAALDAVAKQLERAFGPAAVEPALLRAELMTQRGEPAKAAGFLRAEATKRPGEARLWAALADATANVGGVSTGLGVLDEGQAAAGDCPEIRLARADLYARDPARVRPVAPLADHADGWPDPDQQKLFTGLLEVYDRLGDDAGVIKMSRKLAGRRPADANVWEALAERAARVGDEKSFAEARAALERIDPAGKGAALCDGWRTLAKNSSRDAAAGAAALAAKFGETPERAEACVVLGRLKAQAGDPAAATALLQRGVALEPGRFGPTLALLAHLAADANPQKASAALARLGHDPRWYGEPLRRVVRAAAKQASPAASKALLTAARPVVEGQPGGLGWLGDVFLECKHADAAKECFRVAATKPAPSPDDYLRLALRSQELGDNDSRDNALVSAQKSLPAPLFLILAASFADAPGAKGWQPKPQNPVEERQYVQALLALKLSRYQRGEAAQVLEGFLKNEQRPAADLAWARRNLAMLLVIQGGKEPRDRAMKLLAKEGTDGDTAEEKRATAAVFAALGRYLDGAQRLEVQERGIKVLEGLVNQTRQPRDAFLLAQMYRSVGRRESSTQTINQLLAADPKNLEFHLFALEEITKMTPLPLEVGEQFAQRLTSEFGGDFRVVATVSRFECAAARPERALALAEGYTRLADASTGDLPARQARVAELLDELVRLPNVKKTDAGKRMVRAAVERYEGLAAVRPEAMLAACGLLAFDGRPNDAFAWIDRFGRGQPNRSKAAAGMAVLRQASATDRQFGLVQAWLTAALAEEPDSVALRLNEGEFAALKQDYAAAERAYEEALKLDPKNVAALNNLAWILAPRPEASARALELIDRAVAEIGLTGELLDTRGRVRIEAKQFTMAEADLQQALLQQSTGLRHFHVALLKKKQAPGDPREAADAFRKARAQGLEPAVVHPADLPLYRVLESESMRAN